MRKNGFTLIELLAVIVILAIIALIAVPIVLNIIEDTKNSATIRSADFYLEAVELSIAKEVLEGGTIDGEYTINSSGNICKGENCIEVKVQGQKPTSGKIIIEDGKIKSIYKLLLGGKTISTDNSGNLAIKKYNTYTVTYQNIDDVSGLPTTVVEENALIVNLTDKGLSKEEITVKVNNEEISDYTYTNYVLTVEEVTGNVIVIGVEESTVPTPVSFEEDSWETIIANVKAGNTDAYIVGAEKEITLTSTDDESGNADGITAGSYTVRIANKSNTGDVCTKEYIEGTEKKYSKTACGFVIEFVDIITTHVMNSTATNAGGWPASEMYTYVNETIYAALDPVVKEAIIDTTVVSGREIGKSANYTSTDKLYLLSTKEIYGTASSSDQVKDETRQLDYYSSSEAIKIKYLNGTARTWWLRSAISNISNIFYDVDSSGNINSDSVIDTRGVAAAFRLG